MTTQDTAPVTGATTPEVPDAVVGGGYAVLSRNSVERLRAPRCPFEHGSAESAIAEARRKAAERPGRKYVAVQIIAEVAADAEAAVGEVV